MPVKAIEKILCSDLTNFEPVLFHDSPVVVDGIDFCAYYNCAKGRSELQVWGGEYLAQALTWMNILRAYQKCAIEPLFVFTAGTERRGKQLGYELNGQEKHLYCLQKLKDLKITDHIANLLPLLSYTMLVDLLDDLHITHLCSVFCIRRSCSTIANLMQRPLFASAPEYLLQCAKMPNPNYQGFSYIPLQCINIYPVLLNTKSAKDVICDKMSTRNRQTYALSAHRFLPENSKLVDFPFCFRPLAFVLLGTDTSPNVRLPKFLYTAMNLTQADDYKTRRWNTISAWLSRLSTSMNHPINLIASSYPTEQKDLAALCLKDSLETYIPNNYIASRLLSRLRGAPSQNPDEGSRRDTSTKFDGVVSDCFTSENRTSALDFTTGWPDKLARVFHQSKLANFLLVPLYCRGGVILPSVIEDLNSPHSVWDASIGLRKLHYQFLIGLKQKDDHSHALQRLVTEYVRGNEVMICYQIPVEPSFIASELDNTDSILSNHLGIQFLEHSSVPKSLLSLSITLAIYHQWKVHTNISPIALDRSPVVLAVILCAVANFSKLKTPDKSILMLYENVAKFAENKASTSKKDINKFDPVLSPAFRLDIVHEYSAIQSIYTCLRSATVLLDQLVQQDRCSNSLEFPSIWNVFPSGKLIHWLAVCIANLEPASRRHIAPRYWLPRLCSEKPSADAAASHNRANTLFDVIVNSTTLLLATAKSENAITYTKRNIPKIKLEDFSLLTVEPFCCEPPVVLEPNTNTSEQPVFSYFPRSRSSEPSQFCPPNPQLSSQYNEIPRNSVASPGPLKHSVHLDKVKLKPGNSFQTSKRRSRSQKCSYKNRLLERLKNDKH